MKINWLRKLRKNLPLQRGLLLLLLVFIGTDFVSPQACCGELDGTSLGVAVTAERSSSTVFLGPHDSSCQHSDAPQSPLPKTDDEDCLCCCAHLIPTAQFSFHPAIYLSTVPEAYPDDLPNPPAFGLYRPPRLS